MYCSVDKIVQDYLDEAYDRMKDDALEDLNDN